MPALEMTPLSLCIRNDLGESPNAVLQMSHLCGSSPVTPERHQVVLAPAWVRVFLNPGAKRDWRLADSLSLSALIASQP